MKNNQHVLDFLHKNPMAILSTASKDGDPWGSAIYYAVDEDFNIYFVTRVGTRKYKNIEENPRVSLTITDEENQTTVQAAGDITQVPMQDYMDVIFKKVAAVWPKDDVNWAPPIEKVHEGDYMPLRLTPSSLQYANYRKPYKEFGQEYIEKII